MVADINQTDFWGVLDWAEFYRQKGWQVIPADQKKRPVGTWKEFQNELVNDTVYHRWFGHGTNVKQIGIICGKCSDNLFVIDLDKKNGSLAFEWWADVSRGGLQTPCERSPSGGRHYYFRAPEGVTVPTFKTTIGVDVRGQGGFIVCAPTVRDDGGEYEWEISPYTEEVMEAPAWLLDEIETLRREYGGQTPIEDGHGPVQRTASPATPLDRYGRFLDDRESYARDTVWAMTVNWRRDQELQPLWGEYEARLRSVYDNQYTRKVAARHPDGLDAEGRGWRMFQCKGRHAWSQWDEKVTEASRVERPSRPTEVAEVVQDKTPATAPPTAIRLRPAFPIDARDIPPRDWIVPGLLIRRHTSLLVAPGGSGKSLLATQLGIMLAAGASWGGWHSRQQSRVMIINAEDDFDELSRRMFAATQRMMIRQSDCGDRLVVVENPEGVVVAKIDGKTKAVIRTPLVGALVELIEQEQIDVVIVDPFAETFEGDENSNSEVKWVAAIWREIARKTDCAVFLIHHTKKYASGMAGDQDAARGAGALVNSARISATLFTMSEAEATTFGIMPADRTRYVRFDDAKANLSLITGKAKWFEKVSCDIGNGTDLKPSDDVGVLMPWAPPGLLDSISIHTIWLCLDTIERGLLNEDGTPSGAPYGLTRKGGSARWVGQPIMEHFGFTEDQAKEVVGRWMGSGLLVEEEFEVRRKMVKGVRVDNSKRPGAA